MDGWMDLKISCTFCQVWNKGKKGISSLQNYEYTSIPHFARLSLNYAPPALRLIVSLLNRAPVRWTVKIEEVEKRN